MALRVSVNPFSSVANTLTEDLELWQRLSVHRVGISSVKARELGWAPAVDLVLGSPVSVDYVVHPLYTRVDDDSGWDREARELVEDVEAAAALGAATVYFCSPPAGDLRWEDAAALLSRRLAPVRAMADRHGVRLAVEAVHSSRPEIGFIHTARDAFHLAEVIGTAVCLDLYVHWNERGFAELVSEQVERLAIVQVSDFAIGGRSQPDRVPPGEGGLHMDRVLGDVLDAGFDEVIDIEVLGPRVEELGYEATIQRSRAWVESTLEARRRWSDE